MLEREGPWFRTDCTIHLDTGIVLQTTGRAQEAQAREILDVFNRPRLARAEEPSPAARLPSTRG